MPLIWRARCDLLRGLAQSTPPKQPERRRRLQQLASHVDRTAAEHPSAAAYSANKSLWPLHALAEQAPRWARAVALAEVACMKIDSPFETGAHRDEQRLTHLDFIAIDLGLGAEVGEQVAKTVKAAHAKLSLPLWQDLAPIGGSRGLLALRSLSADTVGLEVLVGADPVGWLGSQYAAGRWLLDGVGRDSPSPSLSGGVISGADMASSLLTGATAVPWTAVGIGAVLGPVLGAAAAGVLTGAIAAAKSSQDIRAKLDDLRARIAVEDEQTRRVAVAAEVFGRHWVTVEATKLLALYAISPAQPASDSPLPSVSAAASRCREVAVAVSRTLAEEEQASGTTSGSANERIKELRQISATLEWASVTLKGASTPEPHEGKGPKRQRSR
jgi:hypothetical protein